MKKRSVRIGTTSSIYERAYIEQWIEKHGTNPHTRARCSKSDLISAVDIKLLINEAIEKYLTSTGSNSSENHKNKPSI